MHAFLYRWLLRSAPHVLGAQVRLPPGQGRRVLITGGTGFIGRPLASALLAQDYRVLVLTRDLARARRRFADLPAAQQANLALVAALEEIDPATPIALCINLAGEPLNAGRWHAARKQQFIASRVQTTQALAQLCQRLVTPPALVLSGSAIGYYGLHTDALLDEAATPAPGFSHQLCAAWEQAAQALAGPATRLCVLRLGVVLGRRGGPLRELLRSFAFGVASRLGAGTQYLSWVHLDDVISAMGFLLEHPDAAGAFNLTAPAPVTQAALVQALAARLRAPLRLPLPAPLLRLLLGEMADELLLQGQRVVPARLLALGFQFTYPALDQALDDLLPVPAPTRVSIKE